MGLHRKGSGVSTWSPKVCKATAFGLFEGALGCFLKHTFGVQIPGSQKSVDKNEVWNALRSQYSTYSWCPRKTEQEQEGGSRQRMRRRMRLRWS